jgi:hypothetical protein
MEITISYTIIALILSTILFRQHSDLSDLIIHNIMIVIILFDWLIDDILNVGVVIDVIRICHHYTCIIP